MDSELIYWRYMVPGVYHLTDNQLYLRTWNNMYYCRVPGRFGLTTSALHGQMIDGEWVCLVDRSIKPEPGKYFRSVIPRHRGDRKTLCGLWQGCRGEFIGEEPPRDNREMCKTCLRNKPKWMREHSKVL